MRETQKSNVASSAFFWLSHPNPLRRIPYPYRISHFQTVAAAGDIVSKLHSSSEAEYTRDAMAKSIYERLFSKIVALINDSILIANG